ncbi:hypothetical protein [Streptomyces sp. NPDC059575]|uniref:hypothetical protein n=1 Tax=Streptomyces sp. NPDC059575 TaxID=3346872 RepID=UPI0036AF1850
MRPVIRPHTGGERVAAPADRAGRCCGYDSDSDSVAELARAGSFRISVRRTVHEEDGRDSTSETWPSTESSWATAPADRAALCFLSGSNGVADLVPVIVSPSPLTVRIAKKVSTA